MKSKKMPAFYISAVIAILGAVGYQYLAKRLPPSLNPIISVLIMYLGVVVLCLILLQIFPVEGGIRHHLRQINWIQIAMAACVILGQLGFILMYRYGWRLSSGNLVSGVVVNIILVALGVGLLGEKISLINFMGIFFSILGVALIGIRS